MSVQRFLTYFATVVLVLMIVACHYDLYLFESGQKTFSDYITEWGFKTTPLAQFGAGYITGAIINFVAGTVFGHWFWPQEDYVPEKK